MAGFDTIIDNLARVTFWTTL